MSTEQMHAQELDRSIRRSQPQTGRYACVAAIAVFAALSIYCGIASTGFIAADACTHYLAARYAWQNPINFVDVWNRPLVTALYAGPAMLGGREAVRLVCMLVAIGCALTSLSIARGQGLKSPQLAILFTLGQPLLFLHSFGEMTELPFALLLGLAFLAWQKERYFLAAILVSWTPLARPEGFGFVAITAAGLLIRRKWGHLLLLPVPLILWDMAGWIITGHSHPWWRWLADSWPYSQQSLYGRGHLLAFVALMPAVVSPVVWPAVIVGIWRSIGGFSASSGSLDRRAQRRLKWCVFLTAALPMFVLTVHSMLYWLGKMASYGEPRYMLVVAPFWGVLAARGWERTWDRLHWQHPWRWAAGAVSLPIVFNLIHPAVPVGLSHDWQSAREMAEWCRSYPTGESNKTLIAGHPGIFYFLNINPHNMPALGPACLASAPKGALLIWDPIFCQANASPDCILTLDEIRRANWEEVSAPEIFEAQEDLVGRPQGDPKDPRTHWHVFRRH